MSEIIDINSIRPRPVIGLPLTGRSTASPSSSRLTSYVPTEIDRVEISEAALALARAALESSARIARQASIRAEIKAGIYETPERLDTTVERLLDEIA